MDKFLNRKREVVSCTSDRSSESEDDTNSTVDIRTPSTKKKCPPKRKYYELRIVSKFRIYINRRSHAGDEARPQCVGPSVTLILLIVTVNSCSCIAINFKL